MQVVLVFTLYWLEHAALNSISITEKPVQSHKDLKKSMYHQKISFGCLTNITFMLLVHDFKCMDWEKKKIQWYQNLIVPLAYHPLQTNHKLNLVSISTFLRVSTRYYAEFRPNYYAGVSGLLTTLIILSHSSHVSKTKR